MNVHPEETGVPTSDWSAKCVRRVDFPAALFTRELLVFRPAAGYAGLYAQRCNLHGAAALQPR